MAAHTVTKATATDKIMARPGLLVRDRAAAGGPIIKLKISRAPVTGTVMVVARASTIRKAISTRRPRMPLASAISGTTEVSVSGRYRAAIAARQTAARTVMGRIWLALTPRISPKSSE